ncbi:MAG: hypothetical protein NTV52_29640 [Acidobacteria bacterium]|nr:hypothetical protein [Acidobacteriota bacterium]
MPQFDIDGEVFVGESHPAVQMQLEAIAGKYQGPVFALVIIGLPSSQWRTLSNNISLLTVDAFKQELENYGFSQAFIQKIGIQDTIDGWIAGAGALDTLRTGLFGGLPPLDLFRYSTTDPCPRSKLVAMVHQARAAESAVRTYILQANGL